MKLKTASKIQKALWLTIAEVVGNIHDNPEMIKRKNDYED